MSTVKESILEAVQMFRLDSDEMPDLIPTGIGPIDRAVGGLMPGTCGILAAATGVGKSSIKLSAALATSGKVGFVEVEDRPDVLGTRIISALTGIDSLKIRRKDLTSRELERILKLAKKPGADNLHIEYCTAGKLHHIERAVEKLAKEGCRLVWLDPLGKVRGHHQDRRQEVTETYTSFQRCCVEEGVAGIAVHHLRRLQDGERVPQIYHLKESGDLENDARLVILAHRDREDFNLVNFRLAKSTYGGEWLRFSYRRDESGTLRECSITEENF